jgi:hypothetical protein
MERSMLATKRLRSSICVLLHFICDQRQRLRVATPVPCCEGARRRHEVAAASQCHEAAACRLVRQRGTAPLEGGVVSLRMPGPLDAPWPPRSE